MSPVKMDPNANGNPGVVPRIGFFGCRGELVRVSINGEQPKKYPKAITLDACPACGHSHGAQPFWRKRSSRDEGKAILGIDVA